MLPGSYGTPRRRNEELGAKQPDNRVATAWCELAVPDEYCRCRVAKSAKLCVDLVAEQHDIVLIDLDEERLEHMIAIADITGVVGNGALYDIQQEAGVASCDVFIAVTPSDETNIIAAITAHTLGARHVIARVRSPEYSFR